MFLVIQFPLSDSRTFVGGETGRIDRPSWLPYPHEDDFLRSFGNVYPRSQGGIYDWIGEQYFCAGRRGLRLAPCPKKSALYYHFGVKVQFRRFYFDGDAVGKYEIGFAISPEHWALASPAEIIDRILALPIIAPNAAKGKPRTATLLQAGRSLALEYLLSTTRHAEEMLAADGEGTPVPTVKEVLERLNLHAWWVEAGLCSLFLIRNRSEHHVAIDYGPGVTLQGRDDLPVLTHRLISHSGLRFSLWAMDEIPTSVAGYETRQRAARELRIALLRVHAERECLRNILVQVKQGKLTIERGTQASEDLQSYLNRATNRLLGFDDRNAMPVVAIANKLDNAVNPSLRDRIRQALEGIRPTVFAKVERVLRAGSEEITGIGYLTGSQFNQLLLAMVDAFDGSELTQMVRIALNERLEVITEGPNLRARVHDLIVWAEQAGRIQQLISGALDAKPRNPRLQRVGDEILAILSSTDS